MPNTDWKHKKRGKTQGKKNFEIRFPAGGNPAKTTRRKKNGGENDHWKKKKHIEELGGLTNPQGLTRGKEKNRSLKKKHKGE